MPDFRHLRVVTLLVKSQNAEQLNQVIDTDEGMAGDHVVIVQVCI